MSSLQKSFTVGYDAIRLGRLELFSRECARVMHGLTELARHCQAPADWVNFMLQLELAESARASLENAHNDLGNGFSWRKPVENLQHPPDDEAFWQTREEVYEFYNSVRHLLDRCLRHYKQWCKFNSNQHLQVTPTSNVRHDPAALQEVDTLLKEPPYRQKLTTLLQEEANPSLV